MKALICSDKETIELSYPAYLEDIMRAILPKLKAKQVSYQNGQRHSTVVHDEYVDPDDLQYRSGGTKITMGI
jgi:hypothetical protein